MMMKICPETRSARLTLLGVLVLMLAFLAFIPTSTGTQVTGVILNVSVDPGETIRHEITIKADEADPSLDYEAKVFGFGMGPDGANHEIDPDSDTSPYSATKFLKVIPTSFHLDAGGSQTLVLEGQVPSDIEAGTRYALVGIKSEPVNMSKNTTIGIATAFQIPVLLTLTKGDLIDTGEITSVNMSQQASGGRQISVMFKNTGNHHYKAQAEAILKDRDGNVLSNASSQLSTSSIIPTYSWLFKLPIAEDLVSGTYTVEATVTKSDGTALDSKEAAVRV